MRTQPIILSNTVLPSSYYEATATLSASGQTTLSLPAMQLDVGGLGVKSAATTLNVNSDTSWDFGQNIGTWTANHSYAVGDWVRPNPVAAVTAPTDLSGCSLWLDASQGVTQVDGKVSQWNDMSGSGNHAAQSNETYRPTYVASAQGGKPTLRFDGDDNWLGCSSPLIDLNRTMFIVNKPTIESSIGSLISQYGVGQEGRTLVATNQTSAGVATPGYINFFLAGVTSGNGSFGYLNHTSIANAGIIFSISTQTGTENCKYWKNGSLIDKGTVTSVYQTNLLLGASNTSGSTPYDGDISEVIIFNRVLTDAERISVETYLTEKYDIASIAYTYECTTSSTSLSSEPAWEATAGGTTEESGGPTWTCYYDYTSPTNRAGTDFYLYACQPESGTTPVFLLSSNATYPSGHTASNSRKVGGFHGLCGSVGTISNHTLTGYVTGDILPASVWCLKHRHISGDNRGLVYIEPLNKWVSIYNISGTQFAPVSAFGGTILDTITWFRGRDAASRIQMRLPTDAEFGVFAAGSNEGTNILGTADPVTVTAAVDTAGRRMISNYGVEGCCGIQWQQSDSILYYFAGAAAHTHNITVTGDAGTFTSGNPSADIAPAWSYKAYTNYKGSLYTQGTYGLICGPLGGKYSEGVNGGSLASNMSIASSTGYATVGLRFIGNNLEK